MAMQSSQRRNVSFTACSHKEASKKGDKYGEYELDYVFDRAGRLDSKTVSAWDPAQPVIPPECSFIQLQADALAAADGADALVICT